MSQSSSHSCIRRLFVRSAASCLPAAKRFGWRLAACILAGFVLNSGGALAHRESNIAKTKHNLSVSGPGRVKIYPPTGTGNLDTTSVPKQTEICVFCHTPHHGNESGVAPGWNRKLSDAWYTTYTSSSLSALDILGRNASGVPTTALPQPGGSSKLCLSCHDGTLAIGNVNVMWGIGTANSVWQMPMMNTLNADPTTGLGGTMPPGRYDNATAAGSGVGIAGTSPGISGVVSGVSTGFTSILGQGLGLGMTDPSTGKLLLDLTNDHPISVSYTHELAVRNGELRDVTAGLLDPAANQQSVAFGAYAQGAIIGFGKRFSNAGYKPMAPLETTGITYSAGAGQVQCATCHDPHLNETDPTVGNQKFLRMNRFQGGVAMQPEFNFLNDIGCMACHDKNYNGGAGTGGAGTNAGTWAFSSHANVNVATQTYTDDAANLREFPTISGNGASTNLPVWRASCLNCHDTHTVQGARWLLREGTDSNTIPKAGGNSAIEETCYQCHSNSGTLSPAVQDIKADFSLFSHMPITQMDVQEALTNAVGVASPTAEVHSIGGIFNDGTSANNCSYTALSTSTNRCGPDFMEWSALLGRGNLANRHAECSDCHNPHRTVPFQSFEGHVGNLAVTQGTNADSTPEKATHQHSNVSGVNGTKHTNVASGSLRGTFGVEPVYTGGAYFDNMPSGYTVKRGDPHTGSPLVTATNSPLYPGNCAGVSNKADCDSKTWVTREYQICLKCHSDYGYADNNTWPYTDLPYLGPGGGIPGLTPTGANNMTHYTNQAREFQAPVNDQGEPASAGSGSELGSIYATSSNHRSWHPVMDKTGRTVAAAGTFTPPWGNDIGNQTMYCSDCHGSGVISSTNSVIPDAGGLGSTTANWGPHGSAYPFILKGEWDCTTGGGSSSATTYCPWPTAGTPADNGLCFKCHDFNSYASGSGAATGFGLSSFTRSTSPFTNYPSGTDGHQYHFSVIGKMRCDWCHTAVPHGFKNKGLLVNLNDVGSEAGLTAGTEVFVTAASGVAYNAGPYYLNARLKVLTFRQSGQWTAADCGSRTNGGGLSWMNSGSETCTNPP